MPQVVYRGSVEELQGSSWDLPTSVIQAGQAASYIESQHRQALAEQAAAAEAEKRQQELLAARLEQQRLAAEAEAALPPVTREDLKAELVNELDDLTRAVLTGAAAVESKELAIIQRTEQWETRHEALLTDAEARISEAEAQTQAAQAVTQATSEQVQSELDNHRAEVRLLENELRQTVSTLQGPQGEVGPIGLAGSGVTVAMEDPTKTDPNSWAQRWFGREGLVAGDGALVPTPNALRVFRYTGTSWVEGPAITPKVELRDVKVSALDNSTKSTTLVTNAISNTYTSTGASPLLATALPTALSAATVRLFTSEQQAKKGTIPSAFTAQVVLISTQAGTIGEATTLLITGAFKPATNLATVEYAIVGTTPGLADATDLPTFTAQLEAATDATVTTQVLALYATGISGTFDSAALQGWCLYTDKI